jgi:hypothetical protein
MSYYKIVFENDIKVFENGEMGGGRYKKVFEIHFRRFI